MAYQCSRCLRPALSATRSLDPLTRPFSTSSFNRADSLTPDQQAQLRSAFRNAGSQGPNLGPFPRAKLDDSDLSGNERRSFRELNVGGKVARVGSKTGQWVFVALGMGITGLVGYSTLSELFARNSPTRLYEQATEKIRQSAEVRAILGDRLVFFGDHPSARRRRSHRVQHTLQPDPVNGRQIMTLTFWVESKTADDLPWHMQAKTWLRELIWEPSDRGAGPPLTVPEIPKKTPASPVSREAASPTWISWLFGSFFSSIAASWSGRSARRQSKPPKPTRPQLGDYTTGEVTATLKQDSGGRFLFVSLTVDVPEKGRGNWRVWVISPASPIRSKGRK